MSNAKITILNNIIGINPTGTLDYNGTYSLNGNNEQIKNSEQISKENLEKTLNGEIVCNNIETFMNENNLYKKNTYKERYTNITNTNTNTKINPDTKKSKQLQNYLNNIIIIFYIILILILISKFIFKKNLYI